MRKKRKYFSCYILDKMIFPVISRILLQRNQYIPVFRNIFASINFEVNNRFISTPTNKQIRTYISVPNGLMGYIDQKLSGFGENSPNFQVEQGLKRAREELLNCLADEAELKAMLEENIDPEMSELARKDLENLEKKSKNIIAQLIDLIVPKPEYDAENAVLEVNFLLDIYATNFQLY